MHACAFANYRQYGTILVRDGINVDTPNRHIDSSMWTPFSIAREAGSLLLPLFKLHHSTNDTNKNEEKKTDHNDKENEGKDV